MKTKLPWLLLALLVAFNIAYIVGLRHTPAANTRTLTDEQINLVVKKVGLDEKQKAEFIRFRQDMAQHQSERLTDQAARLRTMRPRLTGSAPETTEAPPPPSREMTTYSPRRLHQFLMVLRPEQRELFFDMMLESLEQRKREVMPAAK